VGVVVVGLAMGATAEQYSFVGYRAIGMGGANASSVNNASASWHNPAAFGFFGKEFEQAKEEPAVGPVATTEAVAATNVVAEVATNGMAEVASAEAVATNGTAEASATEDAVMAEFSAVTEEQSIVDLPQAAKVEKQWGVDNGHLSTRDFELNLFDFGVGYTLTEDMPEYMTMIGNIDFDVFDSGGLLVNTEDAVRSMLSLGSAGIGLADNPDNAFYVDANAGMSMRIGRFGIGIRTFMEGTGFVEYFDEDNLGIEQSGLEYVAAINSAANATPGFDATGYQYQTINQGDITSISGVAGADTAEKYIDYQLTQLKSEGEGLSDQNIADSVRLLNQLTFSQNPDDPNSTSIENNTSVVAVRGFGLVEVPVSFGYAFNENLSVGITAKGMYGVVSGTKLWFFDEDATSEAMDSASDNSEATLNFGIDIGMLYRMKMLQFAVVGHNLNGPKFDGFTDTIEVNGRQTDITVDDYKIDPQVTIGAAFIPSPHFTLEVSYDLLETGTLLENYDIQRLSFGTEFDLWLLSLRLGAYNNLAADWMGWVGTGGLGLNLWAVRLDVGGAYSFQDTASYEGSDIPAEARLYAGLSFEF
jgi:hypothetical protein